MTVDDLADTMATEFGEEFSDTDIAAQFHEWVIEIVTKMMTAGRWWFLNGDDTVTMVNGQRTYSLASDVSEVRAVNDDENGNPVHYATIEELTRRGKTLTTTGDAPTHWYVDSMGNSQEIVIGLYPVPNVTAAALAALNVKTIDRPPTMTSSSTIDLPAEYIEVAKDGIRALVHFNDGYGDMGGLYEQKFNAGLGLLTERFHGKSGPPQPTPLIHLGGKGDMPVTPEGK